MRKKRIKIFKCIDPMMAQPDKSHLKEHKRAQAQYFLQEKYDGTRGILYKRGNKIVGFVGRNCTTDFLANFPEIVAEAKKIPVNSCTLDGEITFFNEEDHPFFLTARATKPLREKAKVRYMVFDVIDINGENVTNRMLKTRLAMLAKIIPPRLKHIKVVPTFSKSHDYESMYKKIVKRGGEGVMLKKKTSKYVFGSRRQWIKVKKEQTEDCVVVGITEGTGRRMSVSIRGVPRPMFGALVLGQYHNGRLVYVGNVGAGMSDTAVNELYHVIMKLPQSPNPFNESVGNVLRFVQPRVVVEVSCLERTNDGKLRLPVFKRVRFDKNPMDCKF